MTAIARELDQHIAQWSEETRLQVEQLVLDAILWGDSQAIDCMRGRDLEQDVLDILDAP
jgi:hypothetical protein